MANTLLMGEISSIYTISLDNEHSYHVSMAWNNTENVVNETEMDEPFLDTFDKLMVKARAFLHVS